MTDDWTSVGQTSSLSYEPPGQPLRFALLWLHDEDQQAPPPSLLPLLRSHRLACVAPRVANCWWLDRVCPEFDPTLSPEHYLLDQVVPWMADRWKLGRRAIAVAGIGMGGQGAVRLGLRHPEQFPIVASLDGAFDFHERFGHGTPLDDMYPTRERCRQDTAILQLDPHHWPPNIFLACEPESEWLRGNDRLHEKLTAYGVPHLADLHLSDAQRGLEAVLAFVAAALEREARRLV